MRAVVPFKSGTFELTRCLIGDNVTEFAVGSRVSGYTKMEAAAEAAVLQQSDTHDGAAGQHECEPVRPTTWEQERPRTGPPPVSPAQLVAIADEHRDDASGEVKEARWVGRSPCPTTRAA